VPADVVLNELQQHIGHVLAFGGGDGLETVMELDGYVQIHALYLLFFNFADFPHLPLRK
jgi:hypothetical protein